MTRALLISVLLLSAPALTQQQTPPDTTKVDSKPKISVRISTKAGHFRLGQDVFVQVEIWNEGKQDLFISKGIEPDCDTLSSLQLNLFKGRERVGPHVVTVQDCFYGEPSSYPPLVIELSKYWIALPPHHFYGKQVVMHADRFAGLKPGKYRIQGTYQSRGFLIQDISNPVAHYTAELEKLPYPSWAGEVDTNPTWIELTSIAGRPSR